MILYAQHIDEIPACAARIIDQCNDARIFIFNGHLGAGKTTLIKGILEYLGYQGEVTSPTYSIINIYPSDSTEIYHMDLYRLKNIEEALDIGIEEYLISGNYCFIEWPDTIIDLLDEPYYTVNISMAENESRKIEVLKTMP